MATVDDVEVANASFPNVRQDLNDILEALATNFSADAEPTTTYPNQFWYETDTNLLYLRNEANDAWITLASINQTTDEWEPRTGVIQAVDGDGLLLKTDDGTTRLTIADSGQVSFENYSFPTADGSANQVLATDGSGALSFVDQSGGGAVNNLVINGEMKISQRGTSHSIASNATEYTLDRFVQTNGTNAALTISQDSDAPDDFVNSLKIAVDTADADVTNQRSLMGHYVEGQNMSHLNWGTASAKAVTLSFWVRSSLTGTFGGSIVNSAENYSYPYTYTISSADTWEKKTVTIDAPTAGTWLTTNGVGMRIYWSMGTGAYRLGTAGSWSANRYEGATGQINPVETVNATWYITGVLLEVGSSASDYPHRSYAEELALCQRYYIDFGGQDFLCTFIDGNTTTRVGTMVQFPVSMRSAPSMSYSTPNVGSSLTSGTSTEAYWSVFNSDNANRGAITYIEDVIADSEL